MSKAKRRKTLARLHGPWTFKTVTKCPVCLSQTEVKEERIGGKPDDYRDRIRVIHQYDNCNE